MSNNSTPCPRQRGTLLIAYNQYMQLRHNFVGRNPENKCNTEYTLKGTMAGFRRYYSM